MTEQTYVNDSHHSDVLIVGGGWSGLAAAVELCDRGIAVTVIEAGQVLGGRARQLRINNINLDNGQHILLGAYQEVLALLKKTGVDSEQIFLRSRLHFNMLLKSGAQLNLALPDLPAPLHLLVGLIQARGMPLTDKLGILRMGTLLALRRFRLEQDIPVSTLLKNYRQSDFIIEALWQPLCLATLNSAINDASAQVFLNVLHDTFSGHAAKSNILYTRTDLSSSLPKPAHDYIIRHGGKVFLQQRVTAIRKTSGPNSGFELSTAKGRFSAPQVILAMPPENCLQLLAHDDCYKSLTELLSHFEYAPICTAYFQYPETVSLQSTMQGHIGTTMQWVFDRSINGQKGLFAVVISGRGPHMKLTNEEFIALLQQELKQAYPQFPTPRCIKLIREKRATFLAKPGINAFKPAHKTAINGLWLAGDHTDPRYPSTLEGAVRSGILCARELSAAP